jgi:hypothetical protein
LPVELSTVQLASKLPLARASFDLEKGDLCGVGSAAT